MKKILKQRIRHWKGVLVNEKIANKEFVTTKFKEESDERIISINGRISELEYLLILKK